MKPTSFNYARLQIELEKKNEYTNALIVENKRLQKQLDAAVEDMKIMALAMRESEELSEGCCFACICDAQNLPDGCILPYGECPGYERNDCFKWRGAERSK